MNYKVGDTFWKAQIFNGWNTKTVETESVKVVKITDQFYFVDKSELMFNCSKRLKRKGYEDKPIHYHITEQEALYAVLNWKKDIIKDAEKDVEILKKTISEVD